MSRDLGKGRKVVDISRRVYRVEDLPDDLLDAILTAEPGPRSEALNYLMDDDAPIAGNDAN